MDRRQVKAHECRSRSGGPPTSESLDGPDEGQGRDLGCFLQLVIGSRSPVSERSFDDRYDGKDDVRSRQAAVVPLRETWQLA